MSLTTNMKKSIMQAYNDEGFIFGDWSEEAVNDLA
jgi:hypothetical protein